MDGLLKKLDDLSERQKAEAKHLLITEFKKELNEKERYAISLIVKVNTNDLNSAIEKMSKFFEDLATLNVLQKVPKKEG